MKPVACPRLFEVEAVRDGRLAGADLERFRSHLSRCPSCRKEHQALEALGASLRGLTDVAADELHVRRQRTRLLAAFNASLVPVPKSSQRWLVPLLAAAVLFAVALTFTLTLRRSQVSHTVPAAPAREAIAVRPLSPATEWSRRVEGQREIVTLSAGTLSIAIDHALSPRPVRVVLPDGELEDLGTTFSVTVSRSATTHVAVQHGAVILRLRDRGPVTLGAGESWTPATAAGSATTPPPPSAPIAVPAPPSASASSAPPRSGETRRERPAPAPADVASGSALALGPPAARSKEAAQEATPGPRASDAASADFRAALSALDAGNHGLAARRFAAFLARHAADPRAEDAAYLRVIALQRAGNTEATREAARGYLRGYPHAFRRLEIEPLAR